MIVGIRDGMKLLGIAAVTACAVFVCTFFLNYYLDARAVGDAVSAELLPLYEAQLTTAKVVCIISGACLALVAVVLVVFYIGLYIQTHQKPLGLLKAMGCPNGKIALSFWVFGLSVLIGAAVGHGLGYAFCPFVYRAMESGSLGIGISYHPVLTVLLVPLPSALYAALSVGAAAIGLRAPVMQLLRGKPERARDFRTSNSKRGFLRELRLKTLSVQKLPTFLVAFSGFCAGGMLQMSWSMVELSSSEMGVIILICGVSIAAVSFALALSSYARANAKTVALMRAFGYTRRECLATVGGARWFSYLGFAVGTVYQYAILRLMFDFVFADLMAGEYRFNVAAFFTVLAIWIAVYEFFSALAVCRVASSSVRAFVLE